MLIDSPPSQLRAFASWSLLLLLLASLSGCATKGEERSLSGQGYSEPVFSGSETFPVPPEIQPNVDFWRHVYGIWSRGEVAIHDNRYLGVVYEVVKLPEPIKEGYTDAQRDLVRARTARYEERLRTLEERVRAGQRLTADEQALLTQIESAGGRDAVFGAAERLRTQRGLRERFRRGVEISGRYDDMFRDIMRSQGVPEDLAFLPHVESSFQTNAVSSVGAAGIWQFMPATGRMFMTVNDTVDDRLDPIVAAEGAARYLAQAHARLGSWPLAITSYNHGQGGMANAKAQFGDDIGAIVKNYRGQYFGFASRNFYAEFIAAREVTRHANRYFPEGLKREQPWSHDRLVLNHPMPVDHVANHYGLSPHRIADLNLHLRPRARDGRANLPAGTTVWLPGGTKQRVASHPPPLTSSMIARAETKPPSSSSITRQALARSGQSSVVVTRKPDTQRATAATNPTSGSAKKKTGQPVQAKAVAKSSPKPASTPRYHVVKPKETLYRVATQNGITVAELRRLNKLKPDDNHIQPGQKLKVGI